ncbi:MAG: glycosyltransferase family protein [Alcanivorax sp.]
MKLLYGVNGVGSGHLTRAHIMIPKLQAAGADVTTILSGRPADKFKDIDALPNPQFRQGLTIDQGDGGMSFIGTSLNIAQQTPTLVRDVMNMDMSGYDLVITDFEPISAWAAKRAGVPSIGVAHHFAFQHDVPKAGKYSPFMMFMNNIVPVDTPLGLHYDKFDQPILPPIIDETKLANLSGGEVDPHKVLVYMDFEDQGKLANMLREHPSHDFYIYATSNEADIDDGNIHLRRRSREGFQRDFASSSGLITNAGFTGTSEGLHLGKKMLVKPTMGQKEQESNALALEDLGYASTMTSLNAEKVAQWLQEDKSVKITYPDTAQAITDWIAEGSWDDAHALSDELWRTTTYDHS